MRTSIMFRQVFFELFTKLCHILPNADVLQLQAALLRQDGALNTQHDIYTQLCALQEVLHRLHKCSTPLQARLVTEPVPIPALCQALCIMLATAASAQVQ